MWFPLHTHSHFSFLDGLSQPHQIAERIVECGYAGCALTDHGNVCGCPPFMKALQDVCTCGHPKSLHPGGSECSRGCGCKAFKKAGLKPILGCEFYLCQGDPAVREKTNRFLSHLCVLAPRQRGWKNLMRACSKSYSPEFFYHKPRLNLEKLASFSQGEFVVFSCSWTISSKSDVRNQLRTRSSNLMGSPM